MLWVSKEKGIDPARAARAPEIHRRLSCERGRGEWCEKRKTREGGGEARNEKLRGL